MDYYKGHSSDRMLNMFKVTLLLRHTILLVLLSFLSAAAGRDITTKQIRVVFRFDDPSARTNTEMEVKLIEAFRQHNMSCTWAVVPCTYAYDGRDPASQPLLPLPSEKAKVFGDAAREGVLEIALHGFSHQTNGVHPPGQWSEFVGLSYEEQLRKIQQGKAFLETELGVPITVFVPPSSTYDANTIKALEATGFQYLSAGRFGTADSASSLAFLPATCMVTNVEEAVVSARTAPDPSPVITVLFHGYNFLENSQSEGIVSPAQGIVTFDRFVETLKWLSRQPDVSVVPMGEISNATSCLYLANQRIRKSPRLLPAKLKGPLYPLVLLSEEGVRNVKHRQGPVLRLVAFYGGLVLVVGIVSFLAAGVVFVRMPVLVSRLLLLSGPLLLACSLVWAFHDGQFGGRIRMAVAVLGAAAYCAGTWGQLLWHRHQRCRAKSRQTIL